VRIHPFPVHLAACALVVFGATDLRRLTAQAPPSPQSEILERFWALDDKPPTQYRALRHLDARSDKFNSSAWMDVWTEGDSSGFRYQIVAQGGSDYIRSRIFRGTLENEERAWTSTAVDRAAVTEANYHFEDHGPQPDGLVMLTVRARRKDLRLVDGLIRLRPDSGDLVEIEGQLSKPPSFWTRGVQIVLKYQRIGGVRVPVALETVSNVLIAGKSTFRMQWAYESINGRRVGDPTPRTFSSPSSPSQREQLDAHP
jgi:hypothetical protein